jgi:hypothetical protein
VIAVKYYLGNLIKHGPIYAEATSQITELGAQVWAVRNSSGSAFSAEARAFVIEPMPSNRTPEYLAHTRFDSVEECEQIYNLLRNEEALDE